ncbi:MAG: S8 family peptidase [Balneolaceae bacterium]|nr:S8 family peptidase [Balneolaceae bacterium]MBO6545693.1 S8 family peptidase [Balneolaceae bacterium]MBO6647089.1 S8 family peptidase [Balneolaceae bacterium]
MKELLSLMIIILSVTFLNSYVVAQDFYYSNNRKIALEKSTSDLVLKVSSSLPKSAIENALRNTNSIKMVSYLNEEKGLIWIKDKQGNAIKNSIAEVYNQLNIQKEIPVYYLDKSKKDTAWFILTDEFRVKFKQQISSDDIDRINAQHNVVTVSIFNNEYTSGWHLLKVSDESSLTALQAANIYYESGLVEWSVPNYYTEFSYESIDDSYFYLQWYLENTGQEGVAGTDINVVKAWDITTGNISTIVAVLDGGVENHEDFYSGQVLTGISLDNGGNIVGDGSPKVGDQDSEMHGQAVAGIIGANHNNIGIRGVAEKVKILPINVKYNNTSLNQILNIQTGVDWAWSTGNADIINISMGYQTGSNAPQFYDDGVEDAIENAMTYGRQNKGTLVVKSAGNLGFVSFPGNVPGVLTVGGLDAWGDPASGTAMDPTYNFLDVVAPTGDTDPIGDPTLFSMDRMGSLGSNGYGSNYEDYLTGTSFSAPQVSGIAALMLAVNPNLTKTQIFDIIKDRASLHDYGPTQWDGRGRVDAYESVKAALPKASTSITSNTTWSGYIHVENTVNIEDGATLTILPGTKVFLDDYKAIVVRPGGKLIADGTQSDPITFKPIDPDNNWNRIALNSSSGNILDWCLIEGGYINVSVASQNNIISHTTIRDATYRNIQGWVNQDGGGRSSLTMEYSLIDNSSTVGFVVHTMDLDLSYTTIKGSTQAGIYIVNSTVDPFHNNYITLNGSSRDGIEILSSGDLVMHSSGLQRGYNKITNNGDDEISVSGDLIVGTIYPGSGGYNQIYSYYSGSSYLIDNNSGVSIPAYYNHWGAGPLTSAMFDGTVSTSYSLSSDPTSSVTVGHDGQAPSKVNPFEAPEYNSQDFLNAYNDLEAELSASKNSLEIRTNLSRLYQIARLSKDQSLSSRNKGLLMSIHNGTSSIFQSGEKTKILKDYGDVLYTRALIHEARYQEAEEFVENIKISELGFFDSRDILHSKLELELYKGDLDKAWEYLQSIYSVLLKNGIEEDEIRSDYSVLEEDILSNLEGINGNEIQVLNQKKKSEVIDVDSYPNPFNPTSTIKFTLQQRTYVSVKVFDLLGREVAELVNGEKETGEYEVRFDASNLSSGVYIYQLQTNDNIITKRMTLIK